jgi:hypothetical protein
MDRGITMTANTTDLAQRIAELPELQEPEGEARGCRFHTEPQMHSYAIAAQDKYAAPLIERIKELAQRNEGLSVALSEATGKVDRLSAQVIGLEHQNAELESTVQQARALAEKWNKDAVDTGFAMSEPAYELFEILDAATNQGGQQNG